MKRLALALCLALALIPPPGATVAGAAPARVVGWLAEGDLLYVAYADGWWDGYRWDPDELRWVLVAGGYWDGGLA